MDLWSRTVALYGRFSPGMRARLAGEIARRGGRVARDLSRHCPVLVIGAHADSLVDRGTLLVRLEEAHRDGKQVFSEDRFGRALLDEPANGARVTLPLGTALANSGASAQDARLLAAFDLITLEDGSCAFGDVATLKTAASLVSSGCSPGQLVSILRHARNAPKGRRDIVLGDGGEPRLHWADGETTIEGQGLLPLDLEAGGVDDLFERAVIAESESRTDEAARLFDMCARADRSDAIALYNLGNIHLGGSRWGEASLAFRRALARDPDLVEARYNLALCLESLGNDDAAGDELEVILAGDACHADALFNLAQLRAKQGRMGEAVAFYDRFLAAEPPPEWAAKARQARAYCSGAILNQAASAYQRALKP